MPAVRIPRYQQQIGAQTGPTPTVRGVAMPDDPTGAAMANLGATAQDIGLRFQAARREADLTDKLGRATAELTEAELKYENDPDFKTSHARFQQEADAIKARYMQDASDGAVQQAFSKQFGKLSQAKSINIRKGAFVKEKDYNVASLDTSIDLYAKAAAGAKSPIEREFVVNQGRLAIASMQRGGWINNVDAGKRERQFLSKLEEAEILRDMQADPSATADRLAADPNYAGNVDPVQRERWVDQSYRRAESERLRLEREDEKYRKERGDELLKSAFAKMERGRLTREDAEAARPFVSPSEYKSLLKGLHGGDDRRDDPSAYADLQKLIYSNPQDAEEAAFRYHRSGLIKNGTLSSVLERARTLGRSEGPKTEFERSRAYITTTLAPSEMTDDPAPKARLALATREYDDFAASGKRTDQELRQKAEDVVSRLSLVDMANLARKTSLGGNTRDPASVMTNVQARAERLQADYTSKRITEQEYKKDMTELNELRKSAERANAK